LRIFSLEEVSKLPKVTMYTELRQRAISYSIGDEVSQPYRKQGHSICSSELNENLLKGAKVTFQTSA
jgi:hypothetical protein